MNISYTKNYLKVFAIFWMFFLVGTSLFAQFQMENTLAPLSGNDYPIILTNQAKGGHHQVASISERDAIPLQRRQAGMLCTVLDDGTGNHKTYQLIGGLTNSNCVPFVPGSFVYQILSYDPATHILTLENGGSVDLTGLATETDPVWISASANYYDKDNLQTAGQAQVDFGNVVNRPSTAGGYGITDAVTKSYVEDLEKKVTILMNTMNSGGVMKDADGNIYQTVTIGNQIWMAENLKTTKYNDVSLISSDMCWYNNDAATYKNVYSALYNWSAVSSGKLCPVGWHVPTEVDYNSLAGFFGGTNNARLKEEGTSHWISPNVGGDDSSGFYALPGDLCSADPLIELVNMKFGGHLHLLSQSKW